MHAIQMEDGRWSVTLNGTEYTFIADNHNEAIAMAWQIATELRN